MDIRTRLVFALVAVSLASMLALGAVSYGAVRDLLRGIALRQLEAVAESKKEDLEKVIVGWRDRVQLITNRTQLRESLQSYRRSGDPGARERILRTLDDALESVPALRGISVVLPDGRVVATTGHDPDPGGRVHPVLFWHSGEPLVFQNVSLDPEGQLVVTFVAPIRLDGALLGAAKVLLSARELVAVSQDHTGLGETGEVVMARLTETGDALVLNPLRHDGDAALSRRIPSQSEADPVLQAVRGRESVWREGARDYRGEEVWAATRHLEEFDWGLVVKIDRDEEIRAVTELRDTMLKLAVSLSAFAIVIGTLLAFYIARPIRELAGVAHRIRHGELDLRARASSEDEIGQLGATFNEMAQELIEKNRELERRIREHEDGRAPRAVRSRGPGRAP